MARKLVKFIKGYGRYNKGETAGFEEVTALKMTEGPNKVGIIVGDVKEPSMGEVDVVAKLDASAVSGMIAGFREEIDGKVHELAAREAALIERERAVAEREATASPAAEIYPAAPAEKASKENTTEAGPGEKDAGAPPKQGAKK